MRSTVIVKDRHITSELNLPDGTYVISIQKKCEDKTLDQTRKLWATCTDISEKLYGTKEDKDIVYLQILRMAGQRTDRLTIDEEALDDLKKQSGIRSVSVLSRDVVNHRAMAYVEICMTGISDMDRKEVSKVIDAACRYCDELGIVPQIERETYENN